MDDESGECAVEPITCANPMEEAAQRYWRASRIWRDHEASDWNFGQMIGECRDMHKYRGRVAFLAEDLLDKVIRNERPQLELFIQANDDEPQEVGQQS